MESNNNINLSKLKSGWVEIVEGVLCGVEDLYLRMLQLAGNTEHGTVRSCLDSVNRWIINLCRVIVFVD